MKDTTPHNLPRVKICGLTRHQDVDAAIRAGVHYLGFMLAEKSSRKLSLDQANALSEYAKDRAKRVVITVNASTEMLRSIMQTIGPDYIQFHGDETPEFIAKFSKNYAVRTIKAVPIENDEDMKQAEIYSGACDFLLYDAKPTQTLQDNDNVARGGHGITFDWNILKQAPLPKIWALAGGLNPDNAAKAIELTNAPILDLSSGVESAPGIKDPDKINAFMKAVGYG